MINRMIAIALAPLAVWIPALAKAAPTAGQAAPALALKGARLGMTLAQWRALPFGGDTAQHISGLCADAPAPVGAGRRKARKPPGQPPVLLCSYVARYGRVIVPESFALTPAFLARDPEYYFTGGRLSKIEFHVSVDGFNALVALFRGRYGLENQTVRDSVTIEHGLELQRVQKIWRLPGGSLRITDPSSVYNELLVQYEASGAGHLPAARP
jgi:hypothetical protein